MTSSTDNATDPRSRQREQSVVRAIAAGPSRYLDTREGTWRISHSIGTTEYEERYTVPTLHRKPFAAQSTTEGSIRSAFDEYSNAWRQKSATMSVLTDMVLLDEYQRIIGLGRPAIPFIIEALREELDHWFWALKAITGEDHAAGATTMAEAAEFWIAWYDSRSFTS